MLRKSLVQWKHSTVQFSGSWSLVKYVVSEHREMQFERGTDGCRALHFEPLRAKFVDMVNVSLWESRTWKTLDAETLIEKSSIFAFGGNSQKFWRTHKNKSCAPRTLFLFLFSFSYSMCVLPVLLLKPWEHWNERGWRDSDKFIWWYVSASGGVI